MATDNTYDSVKLGFVDGPTTGDFIDLMVTQFSPDNPAKYVGYTIAQGGFSMGPVENDDKWGMVRTLTITVQIEGKSKDDAIARLRTLNRFIQRSNFYFQDTGDNVSSRGDGKWHDGEAGVLTYKPAGATYEVYWDIIRGTPANQPDMITMQNKTLPSVTFSLVVRAAGRLTRVRLNNIVAMGDAAPPFNVSSTAYGGNFRAGWAFTGTWVTGENSTSYLAAKYGVRTLTAQSSAATFTTNGGEVSNATGDVVVPEIWIAMGKVLPTGGALTCKLQTFNGTSWSDQQTFVNLSNFTGLASPSFGQPTWVRYTGTPYVVASGVQQVRLTCTVPTLTGTLAGAIGFDGAANWRNLINNTVPVTEYATGGKTMGIPAFNVYGLRGDVKTPIKMRVESFGTNGAAERFTIVSGMTQDLGAASSRVEYPLFGLDLSSNDSGASTALQLPWGTLPFEDTGAATSSGYGINANIANRTLDRRQRLYRTFIIYAANDVAAISSVKIQMMLGNGSNIESKTFNTALPQTYAGNTTPAAFQYAMYELGDFLFSRPGIAWEENLQVPYNNAGYITLTHSNNANRHTAVAGVILLPLKVGSQMAASVDVGPQQNWPRAVEIYNEGKAPRGAVVAFSGSGNVPIELSSYDTTANMKGGNLWVLPAEASTPTMAMRFEVLMLQYRNDTTKLYTFDAQDTKQVSIEYTPRYLYGMAS